MKITVFDQKNGEAAVIRSQGKTLLVDCGNNEGTEIIEFLASQKIKRIDAIVISSFSEEFFATTADIMRNFDIKTVYVPGYLCESESYDAFMEVCDDEAIEPYIVSGSISFGIGDASIRVSATLDAKAERPSLMTRVVLEDCSMLFMGEADSSRIKELLEYDKDSYDLIRATSAADDLEGMKAFTKDSAPEYALLDSSKDKVVELLKKLECDIYYPEKGRITITCDGDDIEITQ